MNKMKKNGGNMIPAFIILVEILAGVACLLALYLHLPAQRYRSALRIGRKYLHEMKYDEAVNMYHKAVSIEPKRENGYIGLGQAYTAKADSLANAENTKISDVTLVYDEAADAYQKVIDLDQENTDGYYYQAEVYTKAGDALKSTAPDLAYNYYQSALDVYEKVQTFDNNDAVSKEMDELTDKAAASQSFTRSIVEYQQSSEKDTLEINGTDGILRLHNAIFTITDSKHTALGKSLGKLKDSLIEIAEKNQNAGYGGYKGTGYEETMRAEVVRNDGIVFSVRVTDQFSYTHMSEDDPWYRGEWGFNYDTRTGKLLTLDDVFQDSSDLLETIVRENASAAGDDDDALLDRMAATRSRLKAAPIWWLTDSGFVLNTEAEANINTDEGKDADAPDIDWYYSGNGAWTDNASLGGSIDVGLEGEDVERLDMSLPYDKYGSLFQSNYLPRDYAAILNGVDYASQGERCLEDAISRSEETDQEYAKRRASVTKFDFTGDGTDDIVVAIAETYDYENKQAAYCYVCDSGHAVYADEIDLRYADDFCGYQNDLIVRYEDMSSSFSWYNQRFTWNGSEFVSVDTGISNADTEDIFIEDVPGVDISQLTDLYDLSVYA